MSLRIEDICICVWLDVSTNSWAKNIISLNDRTARRGAGSTGGRHEGRGVCGLWLIVENGTGCGVGALAGYYAKIDRET